MTTIDPNNIPEHVAVIMDGNGRWAMQKGLTRILGHQKGTDAVRETVRTSRKIGIKWLTLYAFSEENWQRPKKEINALMNLLKRYLKSEVEEMQKTGIRLRAIGSIHKLPQVTREILLDTIEKTADNREMTLTLALSYGGRQEIVYSFKKIAERVERGEINSKDISEELLTSYLYAGDMPDPDLLIRTSGESRISNFLLWQLAYTEIYITPVFWPDFDREGFLNAISDFQKRQRRFGKVQEPSINS
jgi:undecaprenyl diphosphate synthase